MNRKKQTIIVVIIIILILLIVGIAGTLYFFMTNRKSNREIFINGLIQFMGQEETQANPLEAYLQKKQSTPYENKGSFTVNTSEENVPTIVFSGKTNNSSEQSEQNIEIQYSDDVKFPINYRRDGDFYGLQTQYVSQKYVAIENNNLQELAEKLGTEDTSNIPNKIEIPQVNQGLQFTEEEKAQIRENYLPILSNITDDKISVEEFQTGKQYTLTLTEQEVQNILSQFLEKLKQDNIILNKVSESLGNNSQELEQAIDNLLEQLGEIEETNGENLTIILSMEQDKPTKIELQIPNLTISLQKIETQDTLSFEISIEINQDNQNVSVTASANFNGMGTEQVEENYSLDLNTEVDEQPIDIEYNFENTISFVDSVEIENLTEDTAMILNNYSGEQIAILIQAIANRITEVDQNQMEELGIENGVNPIINMLPLTNLGMNMYNEANDVVSNDEDLSDMAKQSFNAKFLKYEGAINGVMVKTMLAEVTQVQTEYPEYEIKITGIITDPTQIDNIENTKKYNISLKYDEDNLINEIEIQEI